MKEFEVASIKPSGEMVPGKLDIGLHMDGAQVRFAYLALNDYVRMAYKLKVYQVQGLDWTGNQRFDINAKLPAGATREDVPEMLKALLADRFKLKTHMEAKPFPVYALVVAKGGVKIQPVDNEDPARDNKSAYEVKGGGSRNGISLDLGNGSSFSFGNGKFIAKKMNMPSLAEMLARFEDRPVIDMTELKGRYDLTVDIAPEDFQPLMIRSAVTAGVNLPPEALRMLEGSADGSLQTGLQNLGLKLDARKAPIDMLVIDHAEKTPSEN
jgi:uncharacterized protein (TIGR03435 family)